MELAVTITASDTQEINSLGLVVALAQSSQIFAAFAAFENNTITFTNEWGIFASPDPITPGSMIAPASIQYPALIGNQYPFAENAFGQPQQGNNPAGVTIVNNGNNTLTFGMLRGITVNGKQSVSPVSAFTANDGQVLTIVPPNNKISVFLSDQTSIADQLNVGVVLTSPAGPICDVDLDTQNTLHFVGAYDLNVQKSVFDIG